MRTTFTNRKGNGTRATPAVCVYALAGTPVMFGIGTPLGERFSDASDSDSFCIPSVSHLCRSTGPAAISTGIPLIVVDALKSQSRWTVPHVRKERRETSLPTSTHLNAPATVVFVRGVVSVATAASNSLPRVVFRRRCSASPTAMNYSTASAARRRTSPQFAAINITDSSTFAATCPVFTARILQDGPLAERLAGHIDTISHDDSLKVRLDRELGSYNCPTLAL